MADQQRFTVEDFESRFRRSAPRTGPLGVEDVSIVGSAAFTESEDVGRPIRGILLALMLGLASWAAIGVIVAAAIALF